MFLLNLFKNEAASTFSAIKEMNSSGGYTVEVTRISTAATEKDVYDFFPFSGTIEHVEFIRYIDSAGTAYVTFRDAHALGTALLLSGATIADQRVCITRWGHHEEEFDFWNRPSWDIEDEFGSPPGLPVKRHVHT